MNNCNSLCNNKNTIPADPVVLAYLLSWWIDERNYSISDIPVDKITHLNYAFANIDSDGSIAMYGTTTNTTIQTADDIMDEPLPSNLKQLIELKKKYPHLRTLISVGGDVSFFLIIIVYPSISNMFLQTFQEKFKAVIVTNQSRSLFATSCVKFLEKYSFDGIDLDW
jgi:chitinase